MSTSKIKVPLKKERKNKTNENFFIVSVNASSARSDTANPMKWYRKHISVQAVIDDKQTNVRAIFFTT